MRLSNARKTSNNDYNTLLRNLPGGFLNIVLMQIKAHFHYFFWITAAYGTTHQHQSYTHAEAQFLCCVMTEKVISSYIIKNKDETLKKNPYTSYRTMIDNFFRQSKEQHPNLWFEQDRLWVKKPWTSYRTMMDIFCRQSVEHYPNLWFAQEIHAHCKAYYKPAV